MRAFRFCCIPLLFLALAMEAGAQGSSTSLRGVVRDPSGAMIPGAVLTLKDTATGIEKSTTSGADGSYTFTNLQAGTFDLTATAAGFQAGVYKSVAVDTGRVSDVPIELKVGAANQSVEVQASAVTLETSSNEVGATITSNLIQDLPYASRDTLGFALLAPGAQSADSDRNSTFNGLPNASLNISVDGMNNNSQRFKSGGTSFFEFAPSRLDAMEQITVSTTGLPAEAAGGGAMQIRFTTRRGTNKYHFGLVEQFANEDLNANSYFNTLRGLPRTRSRSYQTAGYFSGPLAPFIPRLKNKLFFFAYFEGDPRPSSVNNSTTVLTDASMRGDYTFIGTDGVQKTVNLLQAAAQAGFPGAVDPTVQGILNQINGAKKDPSVQTFEAAAGTPYVQSMRWRWVYETRALYPTARVDYQITDKIAWHGTWNLRHSDFGSNTGPPYPGSPYDWFNSSKITTYVASNQVDWTITPHVINNFTFGVQSNRENFYVGSDIHQWSIYGDKRITLPIIDSWVPNQTGFNRNNPVYQVSDTVAWIKNRHTLTFGGNLLTTHFYEQSWNNAGVLNYGFGVASGDPVSSVIQNALGPTLNRSNNNDLNNALNLYALLTGRVTGVSTSQNVDEISHQYAKYAPIVHRFAFGTLGLYVQDSFRVNPRLTLNYGLHWQLDGDIHSTNGIESYPSKGSFLGPSTVLFAPGVLNGNLSPTLEQRDHSYNRDFNNFAPNFGFAWNPSFSNGLWSKLFGGNKTVISGSYGINFYNEGMNSISNRTSGNQGTTQSFSSNVGPTTSGSQFAFGSVSIGSPVPTLTVNPAAFAFPVSLTSTITTSAGTINYVNPDLRSPYVQTWNFRIQRELAHGTKLELRYVGNKATHIWHFQNINETNIIENGFLQEFLRAQSNRNIARAAGRTDTFANIGLPGQVALPLFDTLFGVGTASPLAASSAYGNTTFLTNLDQGVAGTLANSLASNSSTTYLCRLVGNKIPQCATAGFNYATPYPINFFRANPYISTLNYLDSNSNTNYNAFQVELQKSLSRGFLLSANYVWSHTLGDLANLSDQSSGDQWYTQRNGHLDYGPTPFDRRHSFTSYWIYELPIGKNKWLNVGNGVLDHIVGGWSIGGIERIASGRPTELTGGRATFNQFADGGLIFGNGFTVDELRDRVNTRTTEFISSCTCFKSRVSDITLANGAVDPKFYRPGDVPGVIGNHTFYYTPTQFQLDMNLQKTLIFRERLKMRFRAEASNFLNHPFLGAGSTTVTGTTFGNITSATGTRTIALRGTLDW